MKIQLYSYSDDPVDQKIYDIILSWSPDTFPQPALLPKMGVIVCDDDGTPLVFLCADMSNSVPRAFIDHLQTNPVINPITRYKAVKLAEGFICDRLKNHGYELVYAISRFGQISEMAKHLGYETHCEKVSFFCKKLTTQEDD